MSQTRSADAGRRHPRTKRPKRSKRSSSSTTVYAAAPASSASILVDTFSTLPPADADSAQRLVAVGAEPEAALLVAPIAGAASSPDDSAELSTSNSAVPARFNNDALAVPRTSARRTIFVRGDGTSRTIDISDLVKTDDLFLAVARKLAVSDPSSLVLTYGNKPLRRNLLLSDYGVRPESTIEVLRADQGLLGGATNGADARGQKRSADTGGAVGRPPKLPRSGPSASLNEVNAPGAQPLRALSAGAPFLPINGNLRSADAGTAAAAIITESLSTSSRRSSVVAATIFAAPGAATTSSASAATSSRRPSGSASLGGPAKPTALAASTAQHLANVAPPGRLVGGRRFPLPTPPQARSSHPLATTSAAPAPLSFASRFDHAAPTLLGASFASRPPPPTAKASRFVPKRRVAQSASSSSSPSPAPSASASTSSSSRASVKGKARKVVGGGDDASGSAAAPPGLAASPARDSPELPTRIATALRNDALLQEADLVFAAEDEDHPEVNNTTYEATRLQKLADHKPWLDQQIELARARREQRKAKDAELASVGGDPLERVLERANARLAERRFPPPPLRRDSVGPLATASRTLGLLNAISALSPLPVDHPALELVEGDDPLDGDGLDPNPKERSLARYYLRELEWPDAATFGGFLTDCDRFFPAEIPRWTSWRDELEAQLGAGRDKESPITVLYGGMTIASTPIGRAEQDSDGSLQTCMGQLLALLQHDPPISEFANNVVRRVYELVELRQPAASTFDANLARIGNVEVALIANLPLSLNSADGGRLIRVAALPEVENVVERASATWPDLEQLAPSGASSSFNESATQQHFSDYLAYLKRMPTGDVGQLVDEATDALGTITADASGGCSRPSINGGQPFELLVAKNITLSGLKNAESYTGPAAGRGPALRAELDTRILKSPGANLRRFFAIVNLWCICSRHRLVIIAIIFLIRYIRIRRPILVITESSKMNWLFRSGLVAKSLDTSAAEAQRWLDQQVPSSKSLIKRLTRRGPDIAWRETETEGWIGVIGTVAVVQVGPDAIDTALQVAQMDFGRVKYDPRAQDHAIALGSAALAVAALARRVVLLHLRAGPAPTADADLRKAWLRDAKRATDELVISTGLGAYLEQARREYLDIAQRLASLRGLGYYARHEAIVVAHGGSVADAAADRSRLAKERIAKQEPGPAFIGDPLESKEDRQLVSSCFDSSGKFQTGLVPPPALLRSPRLQQLVEILDADADAVLDGTISPAPAIATRPTGMKKWVEWFITTREGVQMRRSAGGIDTGKARGKTLESQQRIKAMRSSEGFVREAKKRRERGTSMRLLGELKLDDAVKRMNDKFEKGAAPKIIGQLKIEMCTTCLCVFLHSGRLKDFSSHPCVDAERLILRPLFSATALLITGSNPPKKTATIEYIKEDGLQLVRDEVVRALPPVLVEQLELLSIHLPSSAQARLKQGAAIDGALVSLLSDYALSQYEETLEEAETDEAADNDHRRDLVNRSIIFDSLSNGEDRAWGGGVAGGLAKTVEQIVRGSTMGWWGCGTDQCSTQRLLSQTGTYKHECPYSTNSTGTSAMRLVGPKIPANTPILSILPIAVVRRINLAFALGPGDQILNPIVGSEQGDAATALVDRAEEAFWRWRQPA